MSESNSKHKIRDGISPQMALLHLRWQQIRWELLQQAASEMNVQVTAPGQASSKKRYAAA